MKSFAYTVNSQLFIHALATLLILYGLWRPFLWGPPPPPPSDLLSIRSPCLISSLTMLSQRGSQLLSSFSFLFPSQAPAALLSLLWSLDLPDSPRLLSHGAFVAQLCQVCDREASYRQGKTPEDDVCCPLFLLLSSVGLGGVKEGRLSGESIFPKTFLSCSFKWFLRDFTDLWRSY